jgi:hypothetical protein
MENTFSHTRGTVTWFVMIAAISFTVSLAIHNSLQWFFCIGLGAIFLGGLLGNFRTGRFFSWDGPVEPNKFEGILGWSGAVLMLSAILEFVVLVSLGKD